MRLSSILVPIYKLVPILISVIIIYWLIQDFGNITQPGILFLFLFGVIWFVVTFRWKSVYVSGSSLIVSNFLERIEVPFDQVENVEASSFWGLQPQTVKVVLKTESAFGSELIYVPRWLGLNAKPFAEELQRLLASKR